MTTRGVIAIVVALAAGWFVARPALGNNARWSDAVRWQTTVRDGPSDLAADADGVVVTTSQFSVYLLDARGKSRWRVEVDDLEIGQPALGPDVVVVGGSASLHALERADGSTRWTWPAGARVQSVAVTSDVVLAGDDAGVLSALDLRTGALRWSVQHPGALWSAARIDRATGSVVATWHQSDTPAVRVLDLATGALRWEAPTDRSTAAPTLHGGRVFLAVGDGYRDARVEALDLATGEVEWQAPVPASFEEAIEPAADDRAVVVVDHFGVASAFDPEHGRLLWQHDLADVILGTRVVLTARRVAFTSYAGVLHVLDRRDGRELQRLDSARIGGRPQAIVASPWRPGGGVVLGLRLGAWAVQFRQVAPTS